MADETSASLAPEGSVGEPPGAAPNPPAPAPAQSFGSRVADFFKQNYLTFDRRVLGIFRIYFGFLLLLDVLRRIPDATFFYSNEGVLSNHFALYAPLAKTSFSLYTAFSTPGEIKTAFALTAIVYLFYIAGYRTKLFQILAFVLYTSINSRNLFLENGGCVTVAILATWTMFLPLGDRFSVDAVLKSMRERADHTAASLNDREGLKPPPTKFYTIVALGIALEIAAVYFFNTVHKNGVTWKTGEAVHWVLWQNRIATTFASVLRMHEPAWFSPLFSYGTLVVEGLAPIFVLTPIFQRFTRSIHIAAVWSLHIGIALTVSVGPFSYAMLGLNFLIMPPMVIDRVAAWLERGKLNRTFAYRGDRPMVHAFARILARLDTFEKIRFVDLRDENEGPSDPGVELACSTGGDSKAWVSGPSAIVEATRSLPAARLWAVLFAIPLFPWILKVVLNSKAFIESLEIAAASPATAGGPAFTSHVHPALFDRLVFPKWVGREALASILFLAVVIQISHDNWWLPPSLKFQQPKPLALLIEYPRILQGWTMFAPEAPKQDGTLVVDAVTVDGRHIDPLNGGQPDFDAPLHGPWGQTQFRCDYYLKIHFDGNKGYRDELKKYLLNWQRIEGRPANDRIVSFKVWWVSNDSPPPGKTEPTNIRKSLVLEAGPDGPSSPVSDNR